MGPSKETNLAGETRPTEVTVDVAGKMSLAGETDLAGEMKPTRATAGENDLSKVTARVAGVTKVAGEKDLFGDKGTVTVSAVFFFLGGLNAIL